MKKGFFKKGTALAISAAMAVSMLPTLNPIEKVDAATTSESTKTITGLRIYCHFINIKCYTAIYFIFVQMHIKQTHFTKKTYIFAFLPVIQFEF